MIVRGIEVDDLQVVHSIVRDRNCTVARCRQELKIGHTMFGNVTHTRIDAILSSMSHEEAKVFSSHKLFRSTTSLQSCSRHRN